MAVASWQLLAVGTKYYRNKSMSQNLRRRVDSVDLVSIDFWLLIGIVCWPGPQSKLIVPPPASRLPNCVAAAIGDHAGGVDR